MGDFVADESDLHCMLFSQSTDKQAISVYEHVSDSLRDFGKYGRTQNPLIVESFDLDEAQLPSLLIWRTFGENPQIFAGNITSPEAVREFVMNNFVPVFGEFNGKTSQRYMKRGLPILWVAYNNEMNEDALQLLLNSALSIARRYKGQLTFVQLDVDAQPQIAQNFGVNVKKKDDEEDDDEEEEEEETKLPQVFIMNQVAQVKEAVNMEDIEASVQKVIDEYLMQLRIQRGDVMPELQGDDDDDDEFEEDDDDEDEDEDDDDDDEEDDSEQAEEKPK